MLSQHPALPEDMLRLRGKFSDAEDADWFLRFRAAVDRRISNADGSRKLRESAIAAVSDPSEDPKRVRPLEPSHVFGMLGVGLVLLIAFCVWSCGCCGGSGGGGEGEAGGERGFEVNKEGRIRYNSGAGSPGGAQHDANPKTD